jgi:uncharacterized protein
MNHAEKIQSRCINVLAEVVEQLERVEGRVRIQKIMYLLRRRHPALLGGVNFFYHHYGPYSSEVVRGVNEALSWRVLKERVESFDDEMQRYEYTVGEVRANAAPLEPAEKAAVAAVIKEVRGEHWRTLELAATVDFLEQAQGRDRKDAVARALQLKPACKPYVERAQGLLQRLRLPPLSERSIVEGR